MLNTDKTDKKNYRDLPEYCRDASVSDRLRLATMILNDISQQNIAVVDESNTWTEQDRLDITAFSLQYATNLFADNEEI